LRFKKNPSKHTIPEEMQGKNILFSQQTNKHRMNKIPTA